MKASRIIISGVSGKIGKTIVTTAIIKGLKELGLTIQPFKIGPDFIDPSYHNLFSNLPSRNLDSIMFTKEVLLSSFLRAIKNADIAIIEGVFGLYDSVNGISERGSTAEISKIIQAPVILIIDAERVNRSILALLKGFIEFDKDVEIVGIIINNVGSERQKKKMVEAIKEKFKELEIVGIIPRDEVIKEKMKYRHLGLIPIAERINEVKEIEKVIDRVKKCIDLEKIVKFASNAKELPELSNEIIEPPLKIKVGVIKDNVFSFYYQENIEYLQALTEKLYYIDSIHDQSLPDIDLLYIGGGFPEVYAKELEKNKSLKKEIKRKVEKNLRVYGECGGLIYLSNKVLTINEEEYEMIGVINGYVKLYEKPIGHGYVYLKAIKDNPLTSKDKEIIGHEFHYSQLHLKEDVDFAFKVMRGYGIDGTYDGILKKNLIAMYTHMHILHNRMVFKRLLEWSVKDL